MLRKSKLIFYIGIPIGVLISCRGAGTEDGLHALDETPKSIVGYQTIMPHAEGFEAFETYCISCHSLRYIQMQPDLPQKKWEGIVDKMIKSFGAPIPDSTAKEIVIYLSNVKGVGK